MWLIRDAFLLSALALAVIAIYNFIGSRVDAAWQMSVAAFSYAIYLDLEKERRRD